MKAKSIDGNLLFKQMTEFYKQLTKAARAYAELLRVARKAHEDWLRRTKAKAGRC